MNDREEIIETCLPISMTRRQDDLTIPESFLTKTTKNRIYSIYRGMISRCYNPKNNRYELYSRKNVKVCNGWLDPDDGFYNFVRWSLANGYSSNLSLDRRDNNGWYSPENCRFVTATRQSRNTKSSLNVNLFGINWNLRDAVDKFSVVTFNVVRNRLKAGWAPEAAVILPPIHSKIEHIILPQIGINRKRRAYGNKRVRLVEFEGKLHDLKDLCKFFNSQVSYQTVYRRLENLNWQLLPAIIMPTISLKIQNYWIKSNKWSPLVSYGEEDYAPII